MNFLDKLPPRVTLLISTGAAITMALFWLLLPVYRVGGVYLTGLDVTSYAFFTHRYFYLGLLLGNFVMPAVPFVLTLVRRRVDWLWTSITAGYFFTMGIVSLLASGYVPTLIWYLLFFTAIAWAAFTFMRRGATVSFP
ncbi:MAG: hypothetical protein HDR82_06755 [Bacteroides sp.]|nr:hypothetical protein [Bacteroides sp.]